MRITAVCGWAISPEGFRKQLAQNFPRGQIRVIYPKYPGDEKEAESLLADFPSNLYIGHSLGSLWLLHHQQYIPERSVKVLLAPILGFAKEKELGGKISLGQLRYFIRNLNRAKDIKSVVAEFYELGKINMPLPCKDELPEKDVLVRGLEFLKTVGVPATENWISLLGEQDVFLDWTQVQCHLPNLKVVRNAGHSVDLLLKHFAENMDEFQRQLMKAESSITKNT